MVSHPRDNLRDLGVGETSSGIAGNLLDGKHTLPSNKSRRRARQNGTREPDCDTSGLVPKLTVSETRRGSPE
jgi:hypothetical protein